MRKSPLKCAYVVVDEGLVYRPLLCDPGDGQGGLTCCDSWGRKKSDTTEQMNLLTDYVTNHSFLFLFLRSTALKMVHHEINGALKRPPSKMVENMFT